MCEATEDQDVKVWDQASEDQRKSLLVHLKFSHRWASQSFQANISVSQSCSITTVVMFFWDIYTLGRIEAIFPSL